MLAEFENRVRDCSIGFLKNLRESYYLSIPLKEAC